MKVGIATRSYSGMTNEDAAKLMREQGFTSTELCFVQSDSNYWVYNGRGKIGEMSPERALKIVDTYRKNGIDVVSLGVFTNNITDDEDEKRRNREYFEAYMRLASYCGISYVSTECGFDPKDRRLAANRYEADFSRMKETMTVLAEKAEKYGVSIAIEPCVLDVIPSAKRMHDFINQVGSDRIKVLLDPANLIANSSEEDMFRYLAPNIAYFHGKDRKVNDAYGRLLGDGEIDWKLFLSLYHKYTENVPFILEYANKDTAPEALRRAYEFDGENK